MPEDECECTMCSGNCENCEMEEADYHLQMEKDEREQNKIDVYEDLKRWEEAECVAEDKYEKERDDRNEG